MKNAAKCDKECELQNSVNHRIFERTLRPLVFHGACLFERHLYLQALLGVGCLSRLCAQTRLKTIGSRRIDFGAQYISRFALITTTSKKYIFTLLTSDQVGIPAELKHINKRRKRNQQGRSEERRVGKEGRYRR